jgi:hypothetical protein
MQMHCFLEAILYDRIDSSIGNCSFVILGVVEAERLNNHS